MITVLGLTLNIIGTAFVGFVVPRYQGVAYGGPVVTNATGKRYSTAGWALLVVGFVLQLLGALLHQ